MISFCCICFVILEFRENFMMYLFSVFIFKFMKIWYFRVGREFSIVKFNLKIGEGNFLMVFFDDFFVISVKDGKFFIFGSR